MTKEFGSKNLELLKQKDAYSYEYLDSFKRFSKEKLPDKECSYSSAKDGTTDDNGRWSDKWWRLFDVQNNFEMVLT